MTLVITGVGAVTAVGRTADTTFERLIAGERGLGELTLFDPGEVRTRLVAEVRDLAVRDAREVSRTSELALVAAREAIASAGLDLGSRRVGLVLGGTTAGMLETESVLATLLSTEPEEPSSARKAALARMLAHPLSAPTDRLVAELGPFVRARSLSSACSSGANALVVGATWLELGLVDAVLCGGADALCRVTLSGFNALAALDPAGARPFDAGRRGLTLGEGAGFVVLERAGAAGAGAPIATLLGWSTRSEAHHITNPEASGEAPLRAMEGALRRAGRTIAELDYVNAHGTGTPLNDAMEARALERLLGAERARVFVSSQKGMIGHTLGASGAIEAVITALAIRDQAIPPTGGLAEIDPACAGLRHVRRAERQPIRTALSSAFGFGGMDTALVLGRPEDRDGSPAPRRHRVVVTGLAVVTPEGVEAGPPVAALPRRDAARSPARNVIDLEAAGIDPVRGRRLDRASRIAAIACEHALGTAPRQEVGVILGIAFGAVDATAEYMRRLRDKGSRMVRPADFPSLVPSSPAGHVSIYLGLTGPAIVVADLAASGECAVAQGYELVAAGEIERIVVGAVEERSRIVEEVLSVVFAREGPSSAVPRREGAVAIALAPETTELPILARLGEVVSFRADDSEAETRALRAVGEPPANGRALVVLGAETANVARALGRSTWRDVPRVACERACGAHEAIGGVAIAVAAAAVAEGTADAALFVGSARGWSYAGVASAPGPRRAVARNET